MRRTKTPREVAIVKERIARQLLENRLKADSFSQFLARMRIVHKAMADAFIAHNQSEKQISGPGNEAPERVNTGMASLNSFEQRKTAAQGDIELWEKAGVPPNAVQDILFEFDPDRKRFILEVAPQYNELTQIYKKERQSFVEMARLAEGLLVFPMSLRADIRQATQAGVALCTTLLAHLSDAVDIIDQAKKEFANDRNLSRKAVAAALMQLRKTHVHEGTSARSQKVARLLSRWNPEGNWNPNSLRANHSPRSS